MPNIDHFIKTTIQRTVLNYDMSQKDAEKIMNVIMSGQATDAQIASLLTAIRIKGEAETEITGMAKIMRKFATKIKVPTKNLVDTCGTGGDLVNTFNVSTIAALVVAGAGVKVAKHGNRSVSSKCGSADLLEKLGVNIMLTPQQSKKCLQKVGICFMFAPIFHTAMKYAIGPRRQMGIRTIFNILGPLTNPASAEGQVVGVYDEKLTSILAQVLRSLGVKQAFVVHGLEGIDEISISGETRISELRHKVIKTYTVHPEDFEMTSATINTILGGNPTENASIAKAILSGKENSPRTDMVLLNAAAAIASTSKASSLKEGLELAKKSLHSGKALEKLKKLIEFSNKSKPKKKKTAKKKTKTKAKTKKKTVKSKKKKKK